MRVLTWSVPGRGPFSRIVSIPDDRAVALEEWEPNTLMVLSGSGPLNDDDLIVELDEEPLGDLEEAVVKLRARECRSITILREGQELTLERGSSRRRV